MKLSVKPWFRFRDQPQQFLFGLPELQERTTEKDYQTNFDLVSDYFRINLLSLQKIQSLKVSIELSALFWKQRVTLLRWIKNLIGNTKYFSCLINWMARPIELQEVQ